MFSRSALIVVLAGLATAVMAQDGVKPVPRIPPMGTPTDRPQEPGPTPGKPGGGGGESGVPSSSGPAATVEIGSGNGAGTGNYNRSGGVPATDGGRLGVGGRPTERGEP